VRRKVADAGGFEKASVRDRAAHRHPAAHQSPSIAFRAAQSSLRSGRLLLRGGKRGHLCDVKYSIGARAAHWRCGKLDNLL
jgi:hypothetical protein